MPIYRTRHNVFDATLHLGLRTAVNLKSGFNGFPYISPGGACLDALWYKIIEAGPAINCGSCTYCDKAPDLRVHFNTLTLTLILVTAVQPVPT